jgi:hypothetical protein
MMPNTIPEKTSSSTIRISRRAFLTGAAVIATGSTLFTVRQAQLLGPNASLEELLATLQRSTFARFVGDTFELKQGTEEQAALRLATVRDLSINITFSSEQQTRAYHEASFSILFRGPLDGSLQQGTYTVEHRRMGTFPLFIVPMQAGQDGAYYEATFNRLPV